MYYLNNNLNINGIEIKNYYIIEIVVVKLEIKINQNVKY